MQQPDVLKSYALVQFC